jgi:hypothetical protein
MSGQTVTRAIESDFDPKRVYLTLTDAYLIPRWAPIFADEVEHAQGTIFRVIKGSDVFDLEVLANESTLTVDYLRDIPNGKRGGAYIRVMPKPLGGSVVAMTIPVGSNATPTEVGKVLEEELEALIKLL